jgi:predicted peptidase
VNLTVDSLRRGVSAAFRLGALALLGGLAAACAASGHEPSATTGSLAVAVQNLPDGAAASVRITNSAGYQSSISGSQVLSNLAPAAYTITALTVTANGATFTPVPPAETVTVTTGTTTQASITYQPQLQTYPVLAAGFLHRTMVVDGATLPYQIYIPPSYDPSVPHRLILFCHGSDENYTGSNAGAQTGVGLGHYITGNGNVFPDVVVFAQLPTGLGDTAGGAVRAFHVYRTALDLTEGEVNTDLSRVVVTGISSGGTYTWMMAYQEPSRYAAAAPIASFILGPRITFDDAVSNSAGEAAAAGRLATLPIHTYVGSLDTSTLLSSAAADAAAFSNNPNFVYTVVQAADHGGSWDTTYASSDFWTWLRAQHR